MVSSFILLAAATLLPLLPQQGSQSDCNNQTRHKTTCAGNTSTGTANCASFSFTITIAGHTFTFTSPTSCDTGRREQDKDCYDCGPQSDGNHCKARGFKANVKIYSIGGGNPCPTIPDPLPTTLEAASAAVQCKPLPKISDEDNWCASVRSCKESSHDVAAAEDTLILGGGRGARDYWSGPTFDLQWERTAPRGELEEQLLSLPRESVGALPEALRAAFGETATQVGAEVAGTLDVVYFEAGEPWITNRFEFSAYVARHGIHVRERGFVRDEDGEYAPRVESLIHDGRTLLVECAGDTLGHAYLPGYYDLPGVLRARLGPYGLLESWLANPSGLQRLPGTTYESIGGPEATTIVIERYPGIQGPGADGCAVYRLGGSAAVPRFQSVEHRSASGTVRLRRTFAGYSEIDDGVVRPHRVVETIYDAEGRIELSRTLWLLSAQALGIEQARQRGWLTPTAEVWFVYQ